MQERQWTTSQSYAAKFTRDALQRDTFKVHITLLTAASSSVDNDARQATSHAHTTLRVWRAHGLDSEFAKLFLRKPPFVKF